MFKLFKSNAFFLTICDKFRNLVFKLRNFFLYLHPKTISKH